MATTGNPSTPHPRAVVLCADINGLGAIRSLALAGVPTLAVTLSREEPVLHSKFGEKLVLDNESEDSLVTQLLRSARRSDVLMPTSDAFVSFICRNRSLLESRFQCCVPPNHLIPLLLDKADQDQRIRDLSVPLPRTIRTLPPQPQDLISALALPLIIKPRTSEIAKRLGIKTIPIHHAEHLTDWYSTHSSHLPEFVAQELIPGGDGTQWVCMCVFDHSQRLVSCFTFQKIRTAPPGFGVTCFAKSEWNPQIAATVERIGARIGYTGPADFDFKYDKRDGTYKYIEINPRLGMCNYFGTRCGVNCAYDSFLTTLGRETPVHLEAQRDGIMFLNVFDDFYGRAGGPRKSIWSVCAALWDYASVAVRFKRIKYAFFDLTDPAPWRWTTRRDLRRVFASLRQKLGA
jgi:D-aspartate ligase